MRQVVQQLPNPPAIPLMSLRDVTECRFYGVNIVGQKALVLRDTLFSGYYRLHSIIGGFTNGNGWTSADSNTLSGCLTMALSNGWDVYEFESLTDLAKWGEGKL